ncbi:MAG: HU family DNA-binding protein [Chloroflexi bacterium]|nr:HU family DNA-binding protein [Chloroflexota bacterium]
MHKNEFIKQLAKETSLPQKEINQVMKGMVELITRTLREGDKVVLTGFGTFEIRTRKERHGVNPQTKEDIMIAATQTPSFTASYNLKKAVVGKAEPEALSTEFENSVETEAPKTENEDKPKARGRRKTKASA